MHDVFISYSTKDQNQAETVRSVLENNGIACWMAPRDIPTGSNYTKEIPVAIRGCQIFVLILSQNSQSSHWVLKELDSAVNCGKVILPFMLENCQLNDEFNFLLTGTQRYEAYQKKSDSLEALISRIRAITNCQPEMPPRKPEPQKQETCAPLYVDRCPACGSNDLEELGKKTGKYTFGEHMIGLLPWLYAIVLGIAAPLLIAVILSFSDLIGDPIFEVALTVGLFGGIAAGAILGIGQAKKVICRRRIRRGLKSHPLRCKECKKEFLVKKN